MNVKAWRVKWGLAAVLPALVFTGGVAAADAHGGKAEGGLETDSTGEPAETVVPQAEQPQGQSPGQPEPEAQAQPPAKTAVPQGQQEQRPGTLAPADLSDTTVRQLQEALTQRGYYEGEIDGIYGSRTSEAFLRWKADNGMIADEKVTAQVVKELGLSPGGVTPPNAPQMQGTRPPSQEQSPDTSPQQPRSQPEQEPVR